MKSMHGIRGHNHLTQEEVKADKPSAPKKAAKKKAAPKKKK
jgi:hypothetical protein